MTEIEQRVTALERRLDAMANVNAGLTEEQDRVAAGLRRTDEAMARIADRMAEQAELADILDTSLGVLMRAFVEHVRDHPSS